MTRFAGKTCLVTGGGSGIGRAACLRFAAEGAAVAVVDRDEASGRATVEAVAAAGHDARFIAADIGQADQVRAAIDQTRTVWGHLDVLVNNAAMMTFKPVIELAEEDWARVLAVNLTAVFLFCKYAVPHMPPGSAIVNTSSVHAQRTTANVAPYAASKGGIEAFTRSFSQELVAAGIRVNCVAPGAVDTPLLWSNPNIATGAEKLTGEIGKPEDLAAAICFLAGDEARFINGATLAVDGGRLTRL
ncbi:MAG: SDR family oxidoreductase [Alphaproteobacteria bacterium]|nr:SDR family oxidoreductase [Alphaproteobacteria bacterium]